MYNDDSDENGLKSLKKQGKKILRRMKKETEREFAEIGGQKEIEVYMKQREEEMLELFDKKEKKLKKNLVKKQ